jgi:hypothetical protein
MAEQPELDFTQHSDQGEPSPARSGYLLSTGLSGKQMVAALMLVGAVIWAMWVTKHLLAPREERIVTARLSVIVGDYVQAQARSTTPPGQIETEMRRFMASLDSELQRRGARGQVVLVGEAVLTKSVPDITEQIRSAVYASGVARPKPASINEAGRLSRDYIGAGRSPDVPPRASPDPLGTDNPMPDISGFPGEFSGRSAIPSVTSFGERDGDGSR